MTGYTEDLAIIHHQGFSHFSEDASPGLLALFRRHGIGGGLVVDLGCGSGVWARRLLAEGYRVLGIDISEPMIGLAREHAPEAEFRAGSFLDVDLPQCDAITSLGECVNYTFDGRSSAESVAAFFVRAYAALRPGGLLIFDFLEPGQVEPGALLKRHAVGEDWAVLAQSEEDADGRLTRRITSFRRSGDVYRRTDETHTVQLFSAAQLLGWVQRAGFAAKLVRGYGSFRMPRRHTIVSARKPPNNHPKR